MEKEMLEMARKLEKLQRNMFIEDNYIDENIQNFVHELRVINVETEGENEDKNFVNFVGKEITRLNLISDLLRTKKIDKNIQDLIELGNYLKELGDEFIEYGKENQ